MYRLVPCLAAAALLSGPFARADAPATQPADRLTEPTTKPATQPTTKPIDPKPLGKGVKRGLEWLAKAQQKDGGWAQGDESKQMGGRAPGDAGGANNIAVISNVADTCIAAMALQRSGSTPKAGDYAEHLRKAADFVCNKVDAADADSLFVTDVRNTRVQSKIGTHVDTFLAAQFLGDVKDVMPDEASTKRVNAMLAKTLKKIEKHQNPDGSLAQGGWAPVLGEALASKAVNQAAQRGADVNPETLKRFDKAAKDQYDEKTKAVGGGGSAGVELYSRAANSSSFANAGQRLQQTEAALTQQKAAATQPADVARIEKELQAVAESRAEGAAAQGALNARMADAQFNAGFGSNGGEEFLSYLNIGEALVLHGDAGFADWDKKMTENLTRIQNDDGSWSGHHCITGKTFCTSAALMVLMVDRTQAPVADPLKKR